MNILLFLSLILIIILYLYISKKVKKAQIQKIFLINLILLFILCFGVFLQSIFSEKLNINPIYFDYFAYIGGCFLPVSMFVCSLIFSNTKLVFKKKYIFLLIIPIISLLMLWTNNWHHLFYINYSINMDETVFGLYFYIHSAYTYILYFLALFYFLKYSIKNSGIFSKQAILIVIGAVIPIIANILGAFRIIPTSIYLTPVCFSFTVILCALAIFKFNFLKITPIALQRIVDRISDSYLVLNEDYIVTDFNQTLLTTFHVSENDIRNVNIVDLVEKFAKDVIDADKLVLTLEKVKSSSDTFHFEKHLTSVDKYFNIEINDIQSDGNFLGILVLFKDITQHMQDMQTIQNNQNMLMEKERLASLGQLIGGIAHNLKTPIMSISGAAEGLTDLVKEYDSSIGDPEVNEQDHHDIAKDMDTWIEKIKTHTSYMSDIITAVKGQAVTLSENEQDNFTVEELLKRVNILMRHELKNALIDLNIDIKVDNSTELSGNVNSLVQVVNNLISNAIQSYDGKTNESIDLIVEKQGNSLVLSIADHGCGMTKEVQNKLFKEMITTKGKNGTGLGLFMSYSTIRGNFNGNMTFESEVGKGTTFKIVLPL